MRKSVMFAALLVLLLAGVISCASRPEIVAVTPLPSPAPTRSYIATATPEPTLPVSYSGQEVVVPPVATLTPSEFPPWGDHTAEFRRVRRFSVDSAKAQIEISGELVSTFKPGFKYYWEGDPDQALELRVACWQESLRWLDYVLALNNISAGWNADWVLIKVGPDYLFVDLWSTDRVKQGVIDEDPWLLHFACRSGFVNVSPSGYAGVEEIPHFEYYTHYFDIRSEPLGIDTSPSAEYYYGDCGDYPTTDRIHDMRLAYFELQLAEYDSSHYPDCLVINGVGYPIGNGARWNKHQLDLFLTRHQGERIQICYPGTVWVERGLMLTTAAGFDSCLLANEYSASDHCWKSWLDN